MVWGQGKAVGGKVHIKTYQLEVLSEFEKGTEIEVEKVQRKVEGLAWENLGSSYRWIEP